MNTKVCSSICRRPSDTGSGSRPLGTWLGPCPGEPKGQTGGGTASGSATGSRRLARVVVAVVATALVAAGEPQQSETRPLAGGPQELRIIVIRGEGAVNVVGKRAREPIVVQVVDENRRPVMGATVRFTAPESGPGGMFANNRRVYLTRTGGGGRAEARGFRANTVVGEFKIEAEASVGRLSTKTLITQVNGTPPPRGRPRWASSRVLTVVAAAGAGALIGAVIAQGGTEQGTQPVVITPGTPSVGGPK